MSLESFKSPFSLRERETLAQLIRDKLGIEKSRRIDVMIDMLDRNKQTRRIIGKTYRQITVANLLSDEFQRPEDFPCANYFRNTPRTRSTAAPAAPAATAATAFSGAREWKSYSPSPSTDLHPSAGLHPAADLHMAAASTADRAFGELYDSAAYPAQQSAVGEDNVPWRGQLDYDAHQNLTFRGYKQRQARRGASESDAPPEYSADHQTRNFSDRNVISPSDWSSQYAVEYRTPTPQPVSSLPPDTTPQPLPSEPTMLTPHEPQIHNNYYTLHANLGYFGGHFCGAPSSSQLSSSQQTTTPTAQSPLQSFSASHSPLQSFSASHSPLQSLSASHSSPPHQLEPSVAVQGHQQPSAQLNSPSASGTLSSDSRKALEMLVDQDKEGEYVAVTQDLVSAIDNFVDFARNNHVPDVLDVLKSLLAR